MSYEKVFCGSPETDSTEEPPPSMYSMDPEESDLRLKKRQIIDYERPRLAETVNIEDQIMNDDEIARVNAVGDSNARRNFEENEGGRRIERTVGSKGSFGGFDEADRRWIDLNFENPAPSRQSPDRESVIKRRKPELVDSDSEQESPKKDDCVALQCDENMEVAAEEISRPIYEGYISDNESERGSSSEQKPCSLFYYRPHMVTGTPPGGALHSHMGRSDFRPNTMQRAELGRPEQQVPVACSPSGEQRGLPPYGMHGSGAVQFMAGRAGYGNVAVVPSLGSVRFDDHNGMYYAIPMGADSNQYEKFASSFVPMGNILSGDASQTASSEEPASQQKTLSAPKSSASHLHRNTASPSSSSDDRKSNASPALKSDHGSPAPTAVDDSEGKAGLMQKGRGKPKASGGRAEIKCDQCGKTFGSSSALAKHKLTHSDERRYICSTCGKGFKRQDHLNGHMVTHRDKKPFECSYQDCDKSYCDMRSLRRHLDNHHASEASSSSGTPSADNPSMSVDKKTANAPVSGAEHVSSPRSCHKPLRGKSGTGSDLLHVGEYDSGKSSGRSTPGSMHENKSGDVMSGDQNYVSSREHNSDSFSSGASDDICENPAEQRPSEQKPHHGGQEPLKHNSAVAFLKQAAVRAQEQRVKQPTAESWQDRTMQQHQYMVYHHEGMPYQQWYPAAVYSQDPRVLYQYHPGIMSQQVYQFGSSLGVMADAQNAHGQGVQGRMVAENEMRNEMLKNSVGGHGVQTTPSASLASAEAMQASLIAQQAGQTSVCGTPTDAMAIALATAKDRGQYKFKKECYYGVHPSGTQWQKVQCADIPNSYDSSSESIRTSMGNVKTVVARAVSPDNNRTTHSDGETDIVDSYSRGTRCRNGLAEDGFEPPQKRVCATDSSGQSMSNSRGRKDNNDDGVFRNPAEILSPRRIKQRQRPEPLTIPASVSTAYHSNRPGSPHGHGRLTSPPYTPPPMLSPRSIFSHLNFAGNITPRSGGPPQLPMTPSRLLLSNRSCRSSIDHEGEEELPPEPKINIGPQFQAEVPHFAVSKEHAKYDLHRATLCWIELDERKRSRKEEIDSFLDMACSVAVIGGSTNKEYALHILHKCKGNTKEAVRSLLNKKYAIGVSDPLYDYHYEGSSRWAAKERQTFRNSFRTNGKEFRDLKRDVGESKTVAECVEFYYLWKATHPEAVRGRTRYIDSDSEEDDDTGSETNSNPSLFECDFPHCNAKFVSRQALNGHIRVHGGSFMKPSEPRKRNRNPAPAGSLPSNSSSTTTVVRKRRPSPAPAPPPINEDGTLPEFACKVCGRIFHKIKSRSAHMKTHVKRPDDDEKAMKLAMKH